MTDKKIDFDASKIDWTKGNGLIPVIVQDVRSLRVLMLGYVNQDALTATCTTGFVTFFSRSKQRLWKKGETTGHVLHLREIKLDCDNDTLLILAEPKGPTCHLGTKSCFGENVSPDLSVLGDLALTIQSRRASKEAGSYTSRLFAEGLQRIAQKVGEEGVEVALAAAGGPDALASEIADLIYHLSVLLEAKDMSWNDVMAVLASRTKAKK